MSEETKHDKFLRIRDARMEKAVKAISLLSNLSSSNYEFEPHEAQAIIDDMLGAVDEVRAEFNLPAPSLTAQTEVPVAEPEQEADEDFEDEVVAEPVAKKKAPVKHDGPIEYIEVDPAGQPVGGLLLGWGLVGKAMEAVEDKDLDTAHDFLKKALCA